MNSNVVANGLDKCRSQANQINATSADKREEEENVSAALCVPKVILWNCPDTHENNYMLPRRTEEMLQSPLHSDRRSSFIRPEPRRLQSEPRRTKELLQSPLHKDNRSSCQLTPTAARNVALPPRRTKKLLQSPRQQATELASLKPDLTDPYTKYVYSEPRRTKELLASPLHKDMRAKASGNNHLKPCNSKKLFQSPKQCAKKPQVVTTPRLDLVESISDNLYSEPRRIKELLQSPLHKDMRAQMLGKKAQSHKKLSQPVEKKEHVQTPCEHSIKPITNIYSEPRRIKELLQSPLHKDMRATMLSRATKSIYSEPRRTKELLYAQNQENVTLPVRRKLQFNKLEIDSRFQRILSYLQTVFKSVSKRDLQQLGVQNFIIIMQHLLPLTGVAFKPLNQCNYIEQTLGVMKQLKYPHKIMRSALLMPSASLTQVLQLLDFLIELSPKKANQELSVANEEQLQLQLQLLQLEPEEVETAFKELEDVK
ncbi:hypothetical protein KR093_005816 [Drosophila rubida]|uniref:Uncharacterized protein n=1 Tax=Drosophila rubida TaxID=30044 RepID=A0AAD4PNW4_9MUSC|nr:hypothetical protein KR093_005816 [Drosophila rubida]